MMKLGTPIGAAPKSVMRDRGVRVGRGAVGAADRRLSIGSRASSASSSAAPSPSSPLPSCRRRTDRRCRPSCRRRTGRRRRGVAGAAVGASSPGSPGPVLGVVRVGGIGRRRRDGRCGRAGPAGGVVSSPSVGLAQPGSPRSTRPSPSSSAVLEQAGSDLLGRRRRRRARRRETPSAPTICAPTAPAASTAASTPRASVMTRRFLIPQMPRRMGAATPTSGAATSPRSRRNLSTCASGMQRTTVARNGCPRSARC